MFNLAILVLVTAPIGAAELYDLQKVMGRPVEAVIKQFPGGNIVYSTRPNRPLYELRGWRGLEQLLFDTVAPNQTSSTQNQFVVVSIQLHFGESRRVDAAQAAEFLKGNLGIDVANGNERYDPKQNTLEFVGVGAGQWTIYFEAYQIPIHFKHGGVEFRPDHAEPVKERVAEILIR